MVPILIFVLLLGVHLGSGITNNNNNFGPGPHINNNNNDSDDSSDITNNNNNGYDSYDEDEDDYYPYVNPYEFYYRKHQYRHKYRPHTHRPRPHHPQDIVNDNGGTLGKDVGKECPYGKIVNNNPGQKPQVICLPPGVPSTINNNGK